MTATLNEHERHTVARFEASEYPPEVEIATRLLAVAEALAADAKTFDRRAANLRHDGDHGNARIAAAEALAFRNAAARVRQALAPHVPETGEREA